MGLRTSDKYTWTDRSHTHTSCFGIPNTKKGARGLDSRISVMYKIVLHLFFGSSKDVATPFTIGIVPCESTERVQAGLGRHSRRQFVPRARARAPLLPTAAATHSGTLHLFARGCGDS